MQKREWSKMLVTLGIGRSELDQTLYQALEQVKNYEYAGEYDFLEDLGLESCTVSSFFFTQITLKNIFMFFL